MGYQFTVAGVPFEKEPADVVRALRGKQPENVREHWVKVNGMKYPVKQALEALTGIDRADFQSMSARRILRQMGLEVGRG